MNSVFLLALAKGFLIDRIMMSSMAYFLLMLLIVLVIVQADELQTSVLDLALALSAEGDYEGAVAQYHMAMVDFEKNLGPEHIDTINVVSR